MVASYSSVSDDDLLSDLYDLAARCGVTIADVLDLSYVSPDPGPLTPLAASIIALVNARDAWAGVAALRVLLVSASDRRPGELIGSPGLAKIQMGCAIRC